MSGDQKRPRKPSSAAWADFLRARAHALRWLRDEMGETPEQSCKTLAMDPGQVRLILATVDAGEL